MVSEEGGVRKQSSRKNCDRRGSRTGAGRGRVWTEPGHGGAGTGEGCKDLVMWRSCGAARTGLCQPEACCKKPGKGPPMAHRSLAATIFSVQCMLNLLVGGQHGREPTCLASGGRCSPGSRPGLEHGMSSLAVLGAEF